MRIHTDLLTPGDMTYALARVHPCLKLEASRHGSHSRRRAYEVGIEFFGDKVKGDGRRRRNLGTRGGGFDMPYAATWDEWGAWLDRLYQLDPNMKAGPYRCRNDFYAKTAQAFEYRKNKGCKAPWLRKR